METIILASTSPRRQELLRIAGIPFIATPTAQDELPIGQGEDVTELGLIPARDKMEQFLSNVHSRGCPWVLSADTFIRLDGINYGKPAGRESAYDLFQLLSGKTHDVYTSVCLFGRRRDKRMEAVENTKVTFATLTEADIDWYLSTGEWQDAAGGYKIQGKGQCLISRMEGSYSNVMGLPLHRLYVMLKELGYEFS